MYQVWRNTKGGLFDTIVIGGPELCLMRIPNEEFESALSRDAEENDFWGLMECAEVTIPLMELAYVKADEKRYELDVGTQRNQVLANLTKNPHDQLRFRFETVEECRAFFERLREIVGDSFQYNRESWGQLDVLRRRGWIPLACAGFTFMVWKLANDLKEGHEFQFGSHKAKFFYELIRPILTLLGPIGSLAVGVAITAFAVFKLVRLFERPPAMLSLEQKRGRAVGNSRFRPNPIERTRL